MFLLIGARLPPGEARSDVIKVMTRHNISFACSVDPDNVALFLNNPYFKEIESPEETLPGKSGDQVNSSVDPGRPSFTPGSHLMTNGVGSSDAQVKSTPNTLKVPEAIHSFSGLNLKDTVIQNPPLPSSGTDVFGHGQKHSSPIISSAQDRFENRKIVPKPSPQPNRRVLCEIDLTEDSDAAEKESSDEEAEDFEEMEDEEEEFTDAGAHLDPNDKEYKPKGRAFKKTSAPNKKAFSCDVCQKVLSTKRCLENHLRIHGDKPFQCKECKKKFADKKMLKIHCTRAHA